MTDFAAIIPMTTTIAPFSRCPRSIDINWYWTSQRKSKLKQELKLIFGYNQIVMVVFGYSETETYELFSLSVIFPRLCTWLRITTAKEIFIFIYQHVIIARSGLGSQTHHFDRLHSGLMKPKFHYSSLSWPISNIEHVPRQTLTVMLPCCLATTGNVHSHRQCCKARNNNVDDSASVGDSTGREGIVGRMLILWLLHYGASREEPGRTHHTIESCLAILPRG